MEVAPAKLAFAGRAALLRSESGSCGRGERGQTGRGCVER